MLTACRVFSTSTLLHIRRILKLGEDKLISEPQFKGRRGFDGEPVRILLVEDDPQYADLIQTQLRRMSWVQSRLAAAATLAEALEKMRVERFGLVITDLNLPDSAGLATVEALARSGDQLVIVLTGYETPELCAGAMEAGAYDFLSKDNVTAAALERLVRLASLQANSFRSLRESETRFRSLIELSSDFYWETDARHRVIKAEHGLGVHPAVDPAQLGKTRWEMPSVHPDADGWRAHRAVMEARQPFRDFEIARKDADGELRWRSISGEPCFDVAGVFRGYRGVGRDITGRKRSEEELRRFRMAMDASADMILLIDRATMLHVDVNTTACELLGYSREELLKMGPVDLLPVSRAELERAYDDLIAGRGRPTGMNSYYRCKDGSRLPFESTRRVLRSGQNWIIAAISRDARERLASERALHDSESRFRSLTALSSDWYWEQDEEHRFTRIGGSGVQPEAVARLVGKRRWDSDLQIAGGWDAHRALLDARLPFHNLEMWRMLADGSVRHISVSGEPMFDPDGAFIGYRGVGRDISEQKRDEQARRIEHAITRCLAEADTSSAALRGVLRVICDSEGWSCGRYLAIDAQSGRLRVMEAWAAPGAGTEAFLEHARAMTYAPGEGLSGRVWESGEPVWVADIRMDPQAIQAALSFDASMRGAFVFPVTAEGRVIGVLVFNAHEVRQPDERLLQAVRVIGSQIGQFVRRKQTEVELQRSEAEFRNTFELAGSGFAHVGLDGRFLRVNRSLCEMLGYQQHELVGRSVKEISHPDDRDVTDTQRARLRSGESDAVRFEKRYLRKDGSVVWVNLSVVLQRDAEGRPQYEVSVLDDITAQRRAEEEQRASRQLLDNIVENVPTAVQVKAVREGGFPVVMWNKAAEAMYGVPREEAVGRTVHDLWPVESASLMHAADLDLMGRGGMDDFPDRMAMTRHRGQIRVHMRKVPLYDSSGKASHLLVVADDITERKRAEQRQELVVRFGQSALGMREPAVLIDEALHNVLDGLGADAVAYLEPAGDKELTVRAVAGLGEEAKTGPVACAEGDAAVQAMKTGEAVIVEGSSLAPDWMRAMPSAALVPVRGESGVRGLLCACAARAAAFTGEDLNFVQAAASVLSTGLQRIDSEARLAYLAQFDPLTGLPNRALLADRFSQMIVQARRRERAMGVLFIDLDGFKAVNDTLGHAGGDELLKEISVRLQSVVRSGDTVARISGDEFAAVLADLARPEDAALVAQKVLERLAAPVEVLGSQAFVTASIGIAAFPEDGRDAETLLGAADAAMYRAKQSGRNAYQFYTAEITQRTRARAQLGAELRRALEREEFTLYYQPKFSLEDRRIHGAEALLRWQHPERGLIAPGQFVPVLEETGLIVPAGEWALKRACRDLNAWHAQGLRVGPVAVNLSGRQFRQQDLDGRIKSIVAEAGIDPGLIEIEITESQLMQDPDHAIRVMRSLRASGVRIAIDDFGTGYSSLSYLSRFPVASLKIDRSFVAEVYTDASAAAIVRTVIEMAHTLGFQVVAEGVENEEQANFLRLLRCELAQGYLFARPMPAAELSALISSAAAASSGN